MRVQNCRSPPHPRLLRRGQIICMNRRSFTHGANENMGVPGSQPPTERLGQSQQMLNLTQKPTSQMNLSLRCIGCLLWCLTGCTLFSAQEVIHLKEAVDFTRHKTRSNDGWDALTSRSPCRMARWCGCIRFGRIPVGISMVREPGIATSIACFSMKGPFSVSGDITAVERG